MEYFDNIIRTNLFSNEEDSELKTTTIMVIILWPKQNFSSFTLKSPPSPNYSMLEKSRTLGQIPNHTTLRAREE